MKKVSRVDEFESVTGIIKLCQLFINLYILKIPLKISFENLLEMELPIPNLQFMCKIVVKSVRCSLFEYFP